MRGKQIVDLSGRKFTRLTVLGLAGKRNGKYYWKCVCDCGTEKTVSGSDLRTGDSKSCGCLRNERVSKLKYRHGMEGTRTYRCWEDMLKRCYKKKSFGYPWYGARGIKVCDRWKDFVNFFADMGEIPEGLTLDRINGDGDYEPGNCRWATRREQAENQKKTRWITYNGETRCISDWAREYNIPPRSLNWRITKGWDLETALTTPIKKKPKCSMSV